ncbi:hypothetical protein NCCP1664_22530 [Zafaria cholistanensis]|uniref:Uncharacterized protein n=1 Tax=Zafaria cholistanensis TaxID=1682741 RepID=A0A5A7NUX5_9MICC|nr:hypothetical protein NCCP1664_22530 [Zafaria cholistanensis]
MGSHAPGGRASRALAVPEEDAAIFGTADFGIMGGVFKVVPQLSEALGTRSN